MATLIQQTHLQVSPNVSAILGQALMSVGQWIERRRQRRSLMGLSDSLLKDIGVSRADAEREAAKPFWQD